MRKESFLGVLVLAAGCSSARKTEPGQPSPAQSPAVARAQPPATAPAAAKDSVTLERERYVAEVRQEIAGKENLPAPQVFKNIKLLTELSAGRLLAVMNIGYGKSTRSELHALSHGGRMGQGGQDPEADGARHEQDGRDDQQRSAEEHPEPQGA